MPGSLPSSLWSGLLSAFGGESDVSGVDKWVVETWGFSGGVVVWTFRKKKQVCHTRVLFVVVSVVRVCPLYLFLASLFLEPFLHFVCASSPFA